MFVCHPYQVCGILGTSLQFWKWLQPNSWDTTMTTLKSLVQVWCSISLQRAFKHHHIHCVKTLLGNMFLESDMPISNRVSLLEYIAFGCQNENSEGVCYDIIAALHSAIIIIELSSDKLL